MSYREWSKDLTISDLLDAFSDQEIRRKRRNDFNQEIAGILYTKRKSNDRCNITTQNHLDYIISQEERTIFIPMHQTRKFHNITLNDSNPSLDAELKHAKRALYSTLVASNQNGQGAVPHLYNSDIITEQRDAHVKSPVSLRYRHKSGKNSIVSSPGMVKTENTLDYIDFVSAANRPENLNLPSLSSTTPFLNSVARKSKSDNKINTINEQRESSKQYKKHSWLEWDLHLQDKMSENADDFQLCVVSSCESFFGGENDADCGGPKCGVNFVDPDIHKNAYAAALKQARIRHFNHLPFNRLFTRSFRFSYFDLLGNDTTKRHAKVNGMKSIFGNVDVGDFVS